MVHAFVCVLFCPRDVPSNMDPGCRPLSAEDSNVPQVHGCIGKELLQYLDLAKLRLCPSDFGEPITPTTALHPAAQARCCSACFP